VILVAQSQWILIVTGFRNGRGMKVPSLWEQYKAVHVNPVLSPVYGLYRVERGGPAGWAKVAIQFPYQLTVRTVDDSVKSFPTEYDTARRALSIGKETGFGSVTWTRPDSTHLVLEGTIQGSPVVMSLRRIDTEMFLPKSRFLLFGDAKAFNR